MSGKNGYLNGGYKSSADESSVQLKYMEKLPELKPVDENKDGDKEKTEEKKSATFGQLFRTATCLEVLMMIVGLLAAIVHGAGWPVLIIFFGEMTDSFVGFNASDVTNTSMDTFLEKFNEDMTRYSLYYIYIGAAVFVSSYIQSSFWAITCERQVHRIRKQFFNAIMRQEIGWFDQHQSGELTTRLADDLERVREGLGDKFSLAIQFLAQFVSGFVIGFYKGWKMALVMMSLTPVLAVCGGFMAKLLTTYSKREQDKYAKAGSIAEEVLSCIRTVTSFNGQSQDIKRYDEALEESKKLGIKKSWIQGLGIGFTFFTMFSAYALAFWYGTEQVKDHLADPSTGISPGTVLTVFFCVLIGTFSIGNIAPHISSISTAKGAAAVLIEIIDNKPSIDASSTEGQRLHKVVGEIELQDVKFVYPTREDVTVLEKYNLKVAPGQTVALVGPSGCGKSTVVNLIQRFYDPLEGKVLIDGVDIRTLHLKSLRRLIGVVSQEPVLFGLSIRENILLGNPDAREEEVISAAKQANCHDFITRLPKGYDTLVGERGTQLSGGQKQRVAIARALIRDPKILLLDEATSALDTESEQIVQQALDAASEGRTTIVIAHRLSTIQNADMIYVVNDGKIVEAGKHAQLMEQKGEYYQLVTLQMLAEKEDGDAEVIDADAPDVVANGVARKRTLSENSTTKLARQPSKQFSKQISKQLSVNTGKAGDEAKTKEQEKAENARFCRMLRENGPEWPFIVFGCVGAAIHGCTMPAFAIFFSQMIEVFQNGGKDSLLWSMMFLALGGIQFLANSVQHVSFGYSGENLTMRLRSKTFRSMLRQDIAYFDDPLHSTGALTTRLATDASLIKNATGVRIAIIIQSMFGLVAALAISFYYGWKLALVVLAGVPFMAAAGALQMRAVIGRQKKDNEELELAGKTASEGIENIRTVQSLTREVTFYDKYCNYLKTPYKTNLRMTQLQGFSFGFSQGIVFMLYAGCFRFGAYLVSTGDMDPANVFKVFFAISMTGMMVGQASTFLPDYSKAAAAGGIIFKTLDIIPFIDVFSKRGQCPSKISGSIEFRKVLFHYPTRPDVPVLKGINIKVEAGQNVALVGPSGCGKSTVVSLIQRYYDPIDGTVMVDGVNIKDINLVRLRHMISVVSQEPILFDCSIRDNILYGLESTKSMEDVIEAARAANVHEFIANLPQGYDTLVGEKGTQLSGGQKQRVAIARALVRNPQILLLDEATSALDTESEKLVQTALDNARQGRTCVIIAHRLSTIQNCDVIYVVDNGTIAESGNHQQLLNKGGVYCQLVKNQQLQK